MRWSQDDVNLGKSWPWVVNNDDVPFCLSCIMYHEGIENLVFVQPASISVGYCVNILGGYTILDSCPWVINNSNLKLVIHNVKSTRRVSLSRWHHVDKQSWQRGSASGWVTWLPFRTSHQKNQVGESWLKLSFKNWTVS